MGSFIIGAHGVVPYIYYHCNGVILMSVVIVWMDFLQGKIKLCREKASDTSNESMLVASLCVIVQ